MVTTRSSVRAVNAEGAAGSCRWPGEEQKIAVGVADDEDSGAPRLLLEGLQEVDASGLVLDEERANFGSAIDRHRGGEKLLTLADVPTNTGSQTIRRLSRALSRLTWP